MSSRPLRGIYISILTNFLFRLNFVDVLVPYGVSTFLFRDCISFKSKTYLSSRPLRGIYISILRNRNSLIGNQVLVPYGVSTFLFGDKYKLPALNVRSRPLRGIYISIQAESTSKCLVCGSRPLRGIYISILSAL